MVECGLDDGLEQVAKTRATGPKAEKIMSSSDSILGIALKVCSISSCS